MLVGSIEWHWPCSIQGRRRNRARIRNERLDDDVATYRRRFLNPGTHPRCFGIRMDGYFGYGFELLLSTSNRDVLEALRLITRRCSSTYQCCFGTPTPSRFHTSFLEKCIKAHQSTSRSRQGRPALGSPRSSIRGGECDEIIFIIITPKVIMIPGKGLSMLILSGLDIIEFIPTLRRCLVACAISALNESAG